ncbi:hypothetical protein PR001_g28561, partial [Phytophthora rubi]
MPRMRLTKAQQLALCKHRREHAPHATLKEMAQWAATTYRLPRPPSKAAVSRMLKREDTLSRLNMNALQRSRTQPAQVVKLDTMLVEAIMYFEGGGVALNGRLLVWLARKCAEELKIPQEDLPRFTRTGWLRHFQRRHGIRSRRAHGEIDSVDLVAARAEAERLRKVLADYNPSDVFNMDEAALFYQSLPRRSLCVRAAPALKQRKARVTMVVGTNATGSELPLLILGTAKRPRWLRDKPDGVDYKGVGKGWMTAAVFSEWLQDLEARMAAEDRRILLLVDNAPSHKVPEEATPHVRVVKLPPNTTAAIQPMDQGVIATLKARVMDAQTEA